ncbi:MAG: universal stress protein [Eubacterium sp.]|jgi:K+-sensing histidine kinase KdpD
MENVLVCVTKQKTCQRLIDYGSRLCRGAEDTLHIVHVAGTKEKFLGDSEENRALEFLYEKARDAGAELTVLKSDDACRTLADIAKDHSITKVVVGASGEAAGVENFLTKLRNALGGDVELIVVPVDYHPAEDK